MQHNILLTDSHCHLNYIPKDTVAEIILRATDNGIKRMITIGTDYEKSARAVQIANQYENIYATVGMHPCDSLSYKSSDRERFLTLAADKKVIAIGEIGLDFYRDHSPHDVQERVFVEFINIALDLKKPIVIHNRESTKRLLEILSSELAVENYSGIIHCFSGDRQLLDWAVANNFYISVAGQVTYKSAQIIKDSLKHIPLDRLLVETDSPYLTPDIMRGKYKNNEPAFVKYTFEYIAEELNIDQLTLAKQQDTNFNKLFNIPRGLYE